MFQASEKYHQILQKKNIKQAPDNTHFYLTRVISLEHITERQTITPLKSRGDTLTKLQTPSNTEKKTGTYPEKKTFKQICIQKGILP